MSLVAYKTMLPLPVEEQRKPNTAMRAVELQSWVNCPAKQICFLFYFLRLKCVPLCTEVPASPSSQPSTTLGA